MRTKRKKGRFLVAPRPSCLHKEWPRTSMSTKWQVNGKDKAGKHKCLPEQNVAPPQLEQTWRGFESDVWGDTPCIQLKLSFSLEEDERHWWRKRSEEGKCSRFLRAAFAVRERYKWVNENHPSPQRLVINTPRPLPRAASRLQFLYKPVRRVWSVICIVASSCIRAGQSCQIPVGT